jgi:hypothetical protein
MPSCKSCHAPTQDEGLAREGFCRVCCAEICSACAAFFDADIDDDGDAADSFLCETCAASESTSAGFVPLAAGFVPLAVGVLSKAEPGERHR